MDGIYIGGSPPFILRHVSKGIHLLFYLHSVQCMGNGMVMFLKGSKVLKYHKEHEYGKYYYHRCYQIGYYAEHP